MTLWVRNVILGASADVWSSPINDRHSDMPGRPEVQTATKCGAGKNGLFDYLVGACEQCGRYGKAERLGSL
jgi:hypothetical protein